MVDPISKTREGLRLRLATTSVAGRISRLRKLQLANCSLGLGFIEADCSPCDMKQINQQLGVEGVYSGEDFSDGNTP